ncbi:MAG: tetratricopeptide repeat protein [Alphaproteobacteria bacterium]|nr:tetratricopeptide repeat protein [Alphaproteobacteria bacterium]
MRILPWLLAALVVLAVPAHAETAAEARQAELDRLFKALKAAPDEITAAAIEGRIRTLWKQQATGAVALLMSRGERDLGNRAGTDALADFDAALELQPDLSEGYNHRAAARMELGDYAGAVRDIQAALAYDPRNFSALQGLSHIAERQGNWKGALEAWQHALDIDPRTPGGIERLEMLQKKVEGEAT